MEKQGTPPVAIALNALGGILLLAAILCLVGAIIGQEADPLPYGAAAFISGLLFLGVAKIISVLADIEWNTRRPS